MSGADVGRTIPWNRVFWCWIAVRTIVWTAAATFRFVNAPVDVLEMLAWGPHWQAGYYKHPPLPAWCAEWAVEITRGSLVSVYLLSNLFLAGALWAVWSTGCALIGPGKAMIPVLILETTCFFTYQGAEFNHNITLTCFWALAIHCAWRACSGGGLLAWVAYGCCLGLGLLSKYNMVLLIGWQGLALLATSSGRRALLTPGPWIGGAVGLAIFWPHLAWLMNNDWMTLQYLGSRGGARTTLAAYALGILGLVGEQAWMAWGMLVPLLLLVTSRRDLTQGERDGGRYLALCVVGPLLTILFLAMTGRRVIGFWAFPCYSFVGVLVLLWYEIRLGRGPMARAVLAGGAITVGLLALTLFGDRISAARGNLNVRSHFPGRALAEEVTARWNSLVGDSPLPIVAGEHWLADNVAWYSPDRPVVFVGENPQQPLPVPRYSPWTGDADFMARGGVFIWEKAKTPDSVVEQLRQRYPGIRVMPEIKLPLVVSGATITTGMAVMAPSSGVISP